MEKEEFEKYLDGFISESSLESDVACYKSKSDPVSDGKSDSGSRYSDGVGHGPLIDAIRNDKPDELISNLYATVSDADSRGQLLRRQLLRGEITDSLKWVCRFGRYSCFKALIEKGDVDIFKESDESGNPLHWVADNLGSKSGTKKIAKHLIDLAKEHENGVKKLLVATDIDGLTPLHAAAVGRSYSIVSLYLAYGADPCALDFYRKYRPCDYAKPKSASQDLLKWAYLVTRKRKREAMEKRLKKKRNLKE